MATSRLQERIKTANLQGRKALIPFLPGGYPDKERFWREIKALDDNGADIIEIGVPFSDPVADGPTVEQASLDCLNQGVTLRWILEELSTRQGAFKAALVLMGYVNPFLQYGLEALARDAARAGVSGFIVPDMPFEEAGPFRAALSAQGLDLVPLIGLNTSDERMRLYAEQATGFAYFVSVLGTTGERETLPAEVLEKLGRAKEIFTVPLVLGFGIKTPQQLTPFADLVDGVVFGSALISHIRSGQDAASFMARWR